MCMKKLLILLLTACCFLSVPAQENNRLKNIVFEGAGIRGIGYSGAISELENNGLLRGVENVAGTSAGAITALVVALGYSPGEIKNIITGTDFKKFNDGRYLFAGGFNRMNKFFGWYRGKGFEHWIEQLIKQKTGNGNITFRQMNDMGLKDLYVTGTCINKQQLVVFSRHTYPDMPVKDAVRISMSIPLYFEAVFIDKQGKVIHHPKNKEGLNIMVDGGFTGNFPIWLFDSLPGTRTSTIGFRIDRDEQILNDQTSGGLAPFEVKNISQYVSALYNLTIENLNRQQLTAADWQRTVSISDGKIATRIRRLSEKEISTLIENGRQATKDFLVNWAKLSPDAPALNH